MFNKLAENLGLFAENNADSNDINEKSAECSAVTFTTDDDVNGVICRIAEIRNDTTASKNATRKLIYSLMNTDRGWKISMTRNHCATKKALVEKCPKQKLRFVKVCNDLVRFGEI